MSTDIDWQRELDTSFGGGEEVPVDHFVAAGHRAVRRRRLSAVVAGLGAAAVIAGVAWATSPAASPRGEAPAATQGPGPSAEETTTGQERTRAERRRSLEELRKAGDARIAFLGGPAALVDGGLALAPGAGPVLERVPNPMGYTRAQGSSLGLRVMFEGREQYSLMAAFPTSTSTSTVDATGDFAGWLAQAVETQGVLDVANGVTVAADGLTPDRWLSLDPDGQVRAATDRVEVAEVRADVDLGETFARGNDRRGVARVLVDGTPQFVAYTVSDGALAVTVGGGDFDSLDAFIDWAREQYTRGQGMR